MMMMHSVGRYQFEEENPQIVHEENDNVNIF